MNSDLEDYLLNGHFVEAFHIARTISYDELEEQLLYLAYEHETIAIYTFVNSLLIELEAWKLHEIAYKLLTSSLSFIEGAYMAASYHARRAIEITSHQELVPLEDLLFLYTESLALVSQTEALQIAKDIIAIEPNHKLAKQVIGKLSNVE
jgi:hypothetical protein